MSIHNVLITGCSGGIGYATANAFLQKELHVYAITRYPEKLKTLQLKYPKTLHIIAANIAKDTGRYTIVKKVNTVPSLSIVHNAAMAIPASFETFSETLLREHIEVNYIAPLLLTQSLLPKLKQDDQRILHISSGAAHLALPGLLPYCTTKAAFEHSTRCLQAELGQQIACGYLSPHLVDTPLIESFCQADIHALPERDFYRQEKIKKKLLLPDIVAQFIMGVLLHTSPATFSKISWDISDPLHREQAQC